MVALPLELILLHIFEERFETMMNGCLIQIRVAPNYLAETHYNGCYSI
jgi:Lon protease-like protein